MLASCLGTRYLPMNPDDLDWVVEVERELHAFPWTRGNFEDSLRSGYSCWVAWRNGARIAYAVLMAVLDEAHLLDISVAREGQGQGQGRALLDHLCQVARLAGARQLFLEVRPSNQTALCLYQRYGFEQVGRRKNYYPAHEGREDAIVMQLALGTARGACA